MTFVILGVDFGSYLCAMLLKQGISWFWLIAFFGVMTYNVSVFSFYFWNQDKIAQEECVNLDRGITQCQGMCYLADQVVESTPVSQNDLNLVVPGQISFLFYFIESTEPQPWISDQGINEFGPLKAMELDGHFDIFIPPPVMA